MRRRPAYLLRFDDLSPTMNWEVWELLEEALVALGVRPILGVIPDNRDQSLVFGPPHPDFWSRVREWQARGWSIAVHGYQHRYVTADRGLCGWDDRSEFAGLTLQEQRRKLQAATAVFDREHLRTDAWMAPNHSFDRTTLVVLREVGITTITDGLGLFPHRDRDGMLWLPVQLWDFLDRPTGVWTVCLHHNWWGDERVSRFIADLQRYSPYIAGMDEVIAAYGDRRRTWVDGAFAAQRRARKKIEKLPATAASRVTARQ